MPELELGFGRLIAEQILAGTPERDADGDEPEAAED